MTLAFNRISLKKKKTQNTKKHFNGKQKTPITCVGKPDGKSDRVGQPFLFPMGRGAREYVIASMGTK